MTEGRLSSIIHIILFVIIAANLVVLNLWVWKSKPSDEAAMVARETVGPRVENTCDKGCLQKIYDAISESTKSATATPVKSAAPKTTIKISAPSTATKEVIDFYAFGTGSSSAGDWTDVPGMQTYIDSAKYKKIKQAIFEATIRIPTGNEVAYVRLYNVTDDDPAWYSEVSAEGGTTQLVSSQPIFIGTGNKLYQVQMKTSLGFTAYLDQARVRITADQ